MSISINNKANTPLLGADQITVIQAQGNSFDLKVGELWAYRDLILLFVKRDFVVQYKQTILGPLWHIIQPLLTTLMFTIVFGKIAKLSTDGIPPFLFYMSGVVIWTYFSSVFTEVSGTFISNAQTFGKIYFPRLVIPISVLISKLVSFAIQFSFFLILLFFFVAKGAPIEPNWWILITPILLLMMGSFALGGGVIITAMTTRYRDLMVLIAFGVQLLMYLTPVIYPLSSLPEKWQFWASLNPIAPIIETFRYAYLGQGIVNIAMLATSAVIIFITLLLGVVMFNRVERTFMDTV